MTETVQAKQLETREIMKLLEGHYLHNESMTKETERQLLSVLRERMRVVSFAAYFERIDLIMRCV